jgi:hypothetical protein
MLGSNFIDSHWPLIEQYVFAEDKSTFIATVPVGTPERLFFDMILAGDR